MQNKSFNQRGFIPALLTAALLSTAAWAQVPNLENNKTIVTQYLQSRWDESAHGQIGQLVSPDLKTLRAEFQNLVTNARGGEFDAVSQPLDVAIADREDFIEDVIAEGDHVAVVYRITGTHSGNLYGIPATGESIDITAVAICRLDDQKIVEIWAMADEAGLLRQIDRWVPDRSDDNYIAPPLVFETRDGNDVLAEIMAEPSDTDTYHYKMRVAAYKSADPPAGLLPAEGRPYEEYLRAGHYHVGERGQASGFGDLSFGQAFPDRRDQVGLIIAEENSVVILFSFSGTNTNSLFGLSPTNRPLDNWEVGVQKFEGDTWKTGWWFGDDLGMLLKVAAPKEFLIPDPE